MARNTSITPQVMVKNELYWIGPVLNSLVSVFENVLIADCGSTDGTIDVIQQYLRPGVELLIKGELSQKQNGLVRDELRQRTQTTWSWVNDGDEYYPISTLRMIAEQDIPAGRMIGFSTIWNVVQLFDGSLAKLTLGNRCALYPTNDTKWLGDYPSDRPAPYCDDAKYFFYYSPALFGFHMRYVPRSPLDDTTFLRDRHILTAKELPELAAGPWTNPSLEVLRRQ